MNVQFILVQAGIELAREILHAPITKLAFARLVCKFNHGGLCPDRYDFEKGAWKEVGGEKPSVIINASDSDGDEWTLTLGMDMLEAMALFAMNLIDRLLLVQTKLFEDPEEMGETASLWGHDPSHLETLDQLEEFILNELIPSGEIQ